MPEAEAMKDPAEVHKELCKICREDFKVLPLARLKSVLESSSHDAGSILASHEEEGSTLLHWVCQNQGVTLDTVKWLVGLYPEAVKCHNKLYGTPLNKACLNEKVNVEVVKYLADQYPEALCMRCDHFGTPVGCLLFDGLGNRLLQLDAVRCLVDKDPSCVRVRTKPEHEDDLGATVVHQACETRNVSLALLQMLVEPWPESLSRFSRGMLPLHRLLRNDYADRDGTLVDMLEFILDCHPESVGSPTARHRSYCETGNLPLHLACSRNKSLQVIKLIGERYPEAHMMTNSSLSLPLHEYCKGHRSEDLDIQVLQYLIDSNPEASRAYDSHDRLPLALAIDSHTSFETVQYLLEQHPDAVRDNECFDSACLNGNDQVMQHFLNQNPDDRIRDVSMDNENMLHKAARQGHDDKWRLEILSRLIPEGLQQADNQGNLPLHLACLSYTGLRRTDGIHFLLSKHPRATKVRGENGCLPLHLVLMCPLKRPERLGPLIKNLLAAFPNSVKIPDAEGRLPLHYACMFGNSKQTLKWLIDLYPSSLQVVSIKHGLPLHSAAMTGRSDTDAMKYLTESCKDSINTHVGEIGLPLHCAARARNSEAFAHLMVSRYTKSLHNTPPLITILRDGDLQDKATLVKYMLRFPGEVTKRDSNGASPLHYAVASDVGQEHVQRILEVDRDAVKLKDKSNSLPLHYALRHEDPSDALDMLLTGFEEGVRVADVNGFLPIHVACRHGSPLAAVQRLVELYPESILVSDTRGELPLHKACRGGHLSLVEFLAEQNVPSVGQPNVEGVLPVLLLCQRSGKQSFMSDDLHEIGTIWHLIRKYPVAILGHL